MKSRQEFQLKVSNYLPPESLEPELYILDQDGGGGGGGGLSDLNLTGGPGKQTNTKKNKGKLSIFAK